MRHFYNCWAMRLIFGENISNRFGNLIEIGSVTSTIPSPKSMQCRRYNGGFKSFAFVVLAYSDVRSAYLSCPSKSSFWDIVASLKPVIFASACHLHHGLEYGSMVTVTFWYKKASPGVIIFRQRWPSFSSSALTLPKRYGVSRSDSC